MDLFLATATVRLTTWSFPSQFLSCSSNVGSIFVLVITLLLVVISQQLLIKSGDVELNPGPTLTGEKLEF